MNPTEYQRSNYSLGYFITNGQITYKTGVLKKFEVYIGAENAPNIKQPNPIVSANNPYRKYFDASMVWAPIYGRMFYGGLRYKIK